MLNTAYDILVKCISLISCKQDSVSIIPWLPPIPSKDQMPLCPTDVDKLLPITDGAQVPVCLIRAERSVPIGTGTFLSWETLLGFSDPKGTDDGAGEGARTPEDTDCAGESGEKTFWNSIYMSSTQYVIL